MGSDAEQAHHRLVDQLIARGALWSRPLIEAFRTTPRHRFLDHIFHYQKQGSWRRVDTRAPGPRELRLLYIDRALTTRLSEPGPDRPAVPISSSSQPSLMAQMLEDLDLAPGLRTLEIGAGTGYNAALLARLVGRVVSVDVDRRVLAEARAHLRGFPDREVHLHHADGRHGCPEEAPFDRLMVTAAAADLEPAWLEQLLEGGLLLAPLDLAPGLAYLVLGSVRGGRFEGRLTRAAYFMKLRDEDEPGRENASAIKGMLPPEPLPVVAVPWEDWAERRSACGGPGLLPALAFFGWLHGLTVAVQTLSDGRTFYGVADPEHGDVCWLGSREWHVSGPGGQDLGRRLWRAFLEAGGPWPTEFRLRAWPHGMEEEGPRTEGEGFVFRRRGPLCEQVWELIEPRRRPAWS
jgi:protein-L-isoaspartate(D-aspartate) O-methyltransferase